MVVVILTEEQSMKIFLETLIRRHFPDLLVTIIAFRGKQDLEKGMVRFLRAWQVPDSQFIIVHDQDSWDCEELKTALQTKCNAVRSGAIVRIACIELEAWYWGDLVAVEQAFKKSGLRELSGRSLYRDPDKIENPKSELHKYLPQYEQQSGARAIAEHIDVTRNTSHSFKVFFKSLCKIAEAIS
jgi:hypothetical protein